MAIPDNLSFMNTSELTETTQSKQPSATASAGLDVPSSDASVSPVHLEVCLPESREGDDEQPGDGWYSVKSAREEGKFGSWDEHLGATWRDTVTTLNIVASGFRFALETERNLLGLMESLPVLQAVTVTSVRTSHLTHSSFVIELQEICQRRGLNFTLDFVLSPQADAHAALAHLPTTLSLVLEASRVLHEKGIKRVRWMIPLLPELVFRLEALFSLAQEEGIDAALIETELLRSTFDFTGRELDPNEKLFAWDFVTYRLLEEDGGLLSKDRFAYYHTLQESLNLGVNSRRDEEPVAVLRAVGSAFEQPWELQFEDRPTSGWPRTQAVSTDSSVPPRKSIFKTAAQAAEVGGVLWQGLRALGQWGMAQVSAPFRRREKPAENEQLRRVVVIGAYGGEHIGDIAIFGGVLTRIHQRYGVREATLMSQRAAHTRHLVAMLDVPVEVKVEPYEHANIREQLRHADAVVFAGGPLMDLPKQLVLHLYTVSFARRLGKPFIVEGIGAGPFLRWPSAWIGRRLVKMAKRISVRTSEDAQKPLVRNLAFEVGRDPAFDYLETRKTELTRVPEEDRRWLEKLFHDTEGRPLIGLNLRPIRHEYTEGVSAQERAEHTRFIQSRFEQRLAKGMQRLHDSSSVKPCFVFYPMNAIQFGMCDLRSAYRLQRLLGNNVDLRVWEGDASLDGVIQLLRQVNVIISMRFHATIFALSQGRRVIGIDYRIGKRDKVAALLSDFCQSENCARVDEMSTDWIFQRLTALIESPCKVSEPLGSK